MTFLRCEPIQIALPVRHAHLFEVGIKANFNSCSLSHALDQSIGVAGSGGSFLLKDSAIENLAHPHCERTLRLEHFKYRHSRSI
jgi:hypothetical protein